eukprot:8235238-Pyramimonas_sp.AAC.1
MALRKLVLWRCTLVGSEVYRGGGASERASDAWAALGSPVGHLLGSATRLQALLASAGEYKEHACGT